jgi:hypothetical protein
VTWCDSMATSVREEAASERRKGGDNGSWADTKLIGLKNEENSRSRFSCYCRNGFVTLSLVPLQEQSTVVLLLDEVLVYWSLAMDERSGHKNLRGSGCRSVIPYVHRRTELYCSSLYA